MATAPLPQTSPQGGPNPNSPVQWQGLSVFDLPSFGGTMQGALTGAARAAALNAAYGDGGYDPSAVAGAKVGLPGYDPVAPSIVGHDILTSAQQPQNVGVGARTPQTVSGMTAVDPFGSGWAQKQQGDAAQTQFDTRLSNMLNHITPSTPEAIHNWMFGGGGSQEGANYNQRDYASRVLGSDAARTYFSAHPSLLAAAEADPLNFATKLGPVLDAAVAAHSGQAAPGTITHPTLDGPMVKPDANPALTKAMARAIGASEQHTSAMLNHHEYTPQEWLAATEGMSYRQMQHLYETQHYLGPAQQAMALALTMGAQEAKGAQFSPAQQAYEQMLRLMAAPSVAPYLYKPGT